MKKDFLTNFGLTDDEAVAILNEVKSENQQLTDELANLKAQLSDKDAELATAKELSTKYEADLSDLKTTTAIKLALSDSAQDVDIAAGLIDRSKLTIAEDGTLEGRNNDIYIIIPPFFIV